jgi:hypothetical protein
MRATRPPGGPTVVSTRTPCRRLSGWTRSRAVSRNGGGPCNCSDAPRAPLPSRCACANPAPPAVCAAGSFWPYPASANVDTTQCAGLAASFKFVVAGSTNAVLTAAVARYNEIVWAYGPPNAPSPLAATLVNATVTIRDPAAQLALRVDESYNISVLVPAGGSHAAATATISAVTAFGALRGLETFVQMTQRNFTNPPAGGSYFTCAAEIMDAPRFWYRGLLIDTSRHYMNVTSIKVGAGRGGGGVRQCARGRGVCSQAVMELMASLKMNALHVHWTDDQVRASRMSGCATGACQAQRMRASRVVRSRGRW